jgi:RNA polymerase sigma-70 factor, ECF subfamily
LPSGPPTANTAPADAALLARIVAREPEALSELYDRHSRLLFGLILRIVKNRDEAEEVLQEAFVQAWTRADMYHRELGSPAGWLVGIARNRAIDRLRANAVRGATLNTTADDVERGNRETLAPAGEQQLDIERALCALPPEQRELIEQAYYLGLTHSELAERHRMPLGTVKTRIRSGMQTLRTHLAGRFVQQ